MSKYPSKNSGETLQNLDAILWEVLEESRGGGVLAPVFSVCIPFIAEGYIRFFPRPGYRDIAETPFLLDEVNITTNIYDNPARLEIAVTDGSTSWHMYQCSGPWQKLNRSEAA